MDEQTKPQPQAAAPQAPAPAGAPAGYQHDRRGDRRPRFGDRRRTPFVEKRIDDLDEKTLDIRRVTRVVAGGKRMRFRVTLVVGNGKGRVGVGIAKGLDVAGAIAKAKTAARKNVFTVPLNGRTIPHEVEAKFSAARIRLKPAVEGHGLRAGGAARVVLSLAGIKDIVAKTLGRTPNKLTNAMATIAALKKIKKGK